MPARARLTKSIVDRATVDVWCGKLSGFGVRVHPTGKKVFTLLYRMPGSRVMKRLTLGAYGAMTVDEARNAAQRALGEIRSGVDPADAKKAKRDAQTVADVGTDYLADVEARRKPITAKEYARLWNKHVVPTMGNVKVTDVTTSQVSALHRKMRATAYVANRVLALLGAFFTYAEQQGLRTKHTNPAHDVKFYPEHARERFLTPNEVARLSDALARAEKDGLPVPPVQKQQKRGMSKKRREKLTGQKRGPYKRDESKKTVRPMNPFAVAAIRFLLLSGWREREALTLKWSDIDTERKVATLADTKTGRSQRVLGAAALSLLDELPRVSGSPYVFPGTKEGQPLVEINRVWYSVRHAAELDEVRLHDLRHSFASTVASAGGSLLMIGKLLGHVDSKTTVKYAHLLDDPVRAAADSTAAQLSEWMTPSAQPRVLSINSR